MSHTTNPGRHTRPSRRRWLGVPLTAWAWLAISGAVAIAAFLFSILNAPTEVSFAEAAEVTWDAEGIHYTNDDGATQGADGADNGLDPAAPSLGSATPRQTFDQASCVVGSPVTATDLPITISDGYDGYSCTVVATIENVGIVDASAQSLALVDALTGEPVPATTAEVGFIEGSSSGCGRTVLTGLTQTAHAAIQLVSVPSGGSASWVIQATLVPAGMWDSLQCTYINGS